VRPLLPVDSRRGKPWRDHRQVLGGILWKLHTARPWRDVPTRYGPWQTCYSRLRRWQADGTWLRIWALLAAGDELGSRAGQLGQALGAAAPGGNGGARAWWRRRHHDHHSTCRTLGGVHHTSPTSSRRAAAVEILIRSGLGGCGSSARSAAPRASPGGGAAWARTAARNAWANRARVVCRYQAS
jgi:transposase